MPVSICPIHHLFPNGDHVSQRKLVAWSRDVSVLPPVLPIAAPADDLPKGKKMASRSARSGMRVGEELDSARIENAEPAKC